MNRKERWLLLRAAGGELKPGEDARLRRLLDGSGEARAELARMERIGRAVRSSAEDSLAPGFENLVIGALARPDGAGERFTSLADLLGPVFARVAPVALALALVIAVYNAMSAGGTRTPVEAVLGLPHVSIVAAYEAALLAPDADAHSERRAAP
jgi:anti-sigma factor RsiW